MHLLTNVKSLNGDDYLLIKRIIVVNNTIGDEDVSFCTVSELYELIWNCTKMRVAKRFFYGYKALFYYLKEKRQEIKISSIPIQKELYDIVTRFIVLILIIICFMFLLKLYKLFSKS